MVVLLVRPPLPVLSVKPTKSASELTGSPCFISLYKQQFTTSCFRDCNKCAETKCVAISSSPTSSKQGISKGALAGGVVGAILFFVLAVALLLRYRKKVFHKTSAQCDIKDTPAPAEMVLNRPDPMEKHPSELSTLKKAHLSPTGNTVDLGSDAHIPYTQSPAGLDLTVNPFDDTNSIQTAGTEGTNVIPIALVSRDSHHLSVTHSNMSRPTTSSQPMRPIRTPDVNLNLEHLNVSHDNVPFGGGSIRSGVSRNSYMSSASYASEFLNEAPMIVTPTQGTIRQVLGVVKAEVINTSDTLKPPPFSKPAVTSPLATNSFSANQTIKEEDDGVQSNDPFSDENTSKSSSYDVSSSPSVSTFGHVFQAAQQLSADEDSFRGTKATDQTRPSSTCTQAGSVIDIASATRVNLGLRSPGISGSFRTTMGRLVSPATAVGDLQDQPAFGHALRQHHAQDLLVRRVSRSSVVSATSTRADSILESFPFVPPSPISDRPVRSPPVSPLAKQSFTSNSSPLNQHSFLVVPPSPLAQQLLRPDAQSTNEPDALPAPPNRRTLGLSTGSTLSTASSGLGSFPFQIESESTTVEMPPSATYNGRRRASLDTLALTNDLSSYPLSYRVERGKLGPTS